MIANVRQQFRHSLKLLVQDGFISTDDLQALRKEKGGRRYSHEDIATEVE
jgi:hypothetical protein